MANQHDGGGSGKRHKLRSRAWFDNPDNPGMTALYLERIMNFGLTLEELRDSGKPVIGIAQTGSDISPCNRHHIELAQRVRDGIRDSGGILFVFGLAMGHAAGEEHGNHRNGQCVVRLHNISEL